MIKRLDLIFVLFLIVSFPVASAQIIEDVKENAGLVQQVEAQDNDGDGVCNDGVDKMGYLGRRYGMECSVTRVGDLCPDTPAREGVYYDDERSGCSESQLQGINNYWSADIDAANQRPTRVNLNWLTDQYTGVDVYVPVVFNRNPEFNNEKVEFNSATFSCKSDKNYARLTGSFRDSENKNRYTLRVNIRPLTQEEAKDDNVFDEGLIDLRKLLGTTNPNILAAIKIECTSSISQIKLDESGKSLRPVIPHERDSFEVLILLERLAIQPPDVALQHGIDFGESVVEKVDKIVPSLEKIRRITLWGCIGAIISVLALKVVSAFGLDDLNVAADFIWKGPKALRTGLAQGFSKGSFFLSGRAMCAYSVCPASWCRYLNQPTGEKKPIIKDGAVAGSVDKTKLDELNERYTTWLPKGYPQRQITPQDSLFLSVACGCISGIELNLLRIRAIANEWVRCLKVAQATSTYVSYCDKELNKNICQYLVKELRTFYGLDMIGDIFKWIWKNVGRIGGREEGTGSTEKEVEEVIEETGGNVKDARENAEEGWTRSKNFLTSELSEIGTAQASGNMGYFTDTNAEVMLCEVAIYRRMPELDVFDRFDLDRVAWETTIAGEWITKAAYEAVENKVVRAYSVSWTIIAGSDNFPYEVYLKNDAGARRILGKGVLQKAGDLNADYKEITDELDYSWMCVDVFREVYRTRCFPPGEFSEGGPLNIYQEEEGDSDDDRLPDEWEKKYNCYDERTDFETEQDRKDCNELLSKNKENRLDPNNKDSNKNNIDDWQENPDGDIYINYDEFENDYNPNIADKTSKGEAVSHECWVKNVGWMNLIGGVDYGNIIKYSPGDVLGININGFDLGEGTGASVIESDVMAKVEINGPDSYYKLLGRKTINEIKNGIEWQIPSRGISDGIYNIKIGYESKTGLIAYEPCVETYPRGEMAKVEKNVLIYESGSGNCVDSDSGRMYVTNGICIDYRNQIYSDNCNENKLREFYCQDNVCVTEDVSCKDLCVVDKCPTGI